MSKRQPNDVSASVKSRLLNIARESGEEFNLLLIRYGIERLLYRLSNSGYADLFVLKGAILFRFRADAPHRPTRDVDLLSRGSSDVSRMEEIFKQVARTEVINDGLTFDDSTVQAERIKADQEYEGIRIHLEARLGTARIRLQIDIGFGDAITPKPKKRDIPCVLDFDAPRLSVYPWETVVAEKYHTIVDLGMTNSRMKDFFDLGYMAREIGFNGESLSKAIRATFERRKTDIPDSRPIAFSEHFSGDATVRTRWLAFLRRSRLEAIGLQVVADEIWSFLEPVTRALILRKALEKKWEPGGPWM